MPKRFKDLASLIAAVDTTRAGELAKGLVLRIRDMSYQAPETLIEHLSGVSEVMDAIADSLALDTEAKRIARTMRDRVIPWLETQREVMIKPLGGNRIRIRWRDEHGGGEFDTTTKYMLPHLGRALAGEVPPDMDDE